MAAGALACLGLALGFAWFYLYDGVYLQPARQADGQTAELTLQVAGYPVQTDDGCWVDGTVFLEGRPYGTRLYLQQEEALEPGDQVTVPAQLRLTAHGGSREPTHHRTSGIFLLAYTREAGTVTRGGGGLRDAPARLRRGVGRQIEGLFSPDTGGFAQALLLGEKAGLSYSQRNELSLAGMSHIVAVSGMHLSILFALVYALTLRQRVLSALLGIPVAFFFAAVAGFTPSVTRAAVMLSLSLLGPPVQAGVRSAVCFGLCRSGAAPGESFDGGIGQLSAVCGGSGGDFVLQQPAVRLDDPRAGKGQRLWTAGMPRSGVICGGEPGGYGVYGSHGRLDLRSREPSVAPYQSGEPLGSESGVLWRPGSLWAGSCLAAPG